MTAFYYSATFDESIGMLRALCELGFRVIPNTTFERDSAPEHARVDDALVGALRLAPGFHLAGDFTRAPVALRRLDSGAEAGRYLVDAMNQGPVLEGLLAREVAIDGQRTLLLGYLSHQQKYKNAQTGQWEGASAELKSAWRTASAAMKKLLVKDASVRFPIGPEALRLVGKREARLQQHFAGEAQHGVPARGSKRFA